MPNAPLARPPSAPAGAGGLIGLLGLLGVAGGTAGCVSRVAMAQVEGDDGQTPHTVVLYSGVRDTSRRYADYTVVDAAILDTTTLEGGR